MPAKAGILILKHEDTENELGKAHALVRRMALRTVASALPMKSFQRTLASRSGMRMDKADGAHGTMQQ